MSSKSRDFDEFNDDDEFFMNEVVEDERDRSNNPVYVEADSKARGKQPQEQESDCFSAALEQDFANASETQDSSSESDEDVMIISESKAASAPVKYNFPPARRLRSQTSRMIGIGETKQTIPLLATTRRKRRKLTGNTKQPHFSEENLPKSKLKNTDNGPLSTQCGEDEAPQKVYNVKFLSRLDGSMGKVFQAKALGKHEFTSILESALDRIVKEHEISQELQKHYAVDSVTLYWNNAKLLKFMTCDALQIHRSPGVEIVDVETTMVHKEREQEYEQRLRSRIMMAEAVAIDRSKYNIRTTKNEEESFKVGGMVHQTDSTLAKDDESQMLPADLDKQSNSIAVKLTLVGQDNKRLYVHVRPSTPFSKVAEYYKAQRSVPKTTQIKLVFDHEELDLNETIEDQDLENEDMIEVVL